MPALTSNPGCSGGWGYFSSYSSSYRPYYTQKRLQKGRQTRPTSQYNQKLFGGDMEKFIQVFAGLVLWLEMLLGTGNTLLHVVIQWAWPWATVRGQSLAVFHTPAMTN